MQRQAPAPKEPHYVYDFTRNVEQKWMAMRKTRESGSKNHYVEKRNPRSTRSMMVTVQRMIIQRFLVLMHAVPLSCSRVAMHAVKSPHPTWPAGQSHEACCVPQQASPRP